MYNNLLFTNKYNVSTGKLARKYSLDMTVGVLKDHSSMMSHKVGGGDSAQVRNKGRGLKEYPNLRDVIYERSLVGCKQEK